MLTARGFIKGEVNRLTILDYGTFQVHQNGRIIGIIGFLIQTNQGENILVDTGFPPAYVLDPDTASAADGLDSFGRVLSLTSANRPAAQLALCGLTPADINLLILTHSHIDHVGGLADFPGVPVLRSMAEAALSKPLYFRDKRPMDWPVATFLSIDKDTQIGPGLRVLLTPGHVPGQLALWLDLPDSGPVLLTSDAISRPAEVDERFDTADDPEAAISSALRILKLAAGAQATVIYGHCPAQWPLLPKAPDSFS
jgi:N-acyl homoserine lactone hydrolase